MRATAAIVLALAALLPRVTIAQDAAELDAAGRSSPPASTEVTFAFTSPEERIHAIQGAIERAAAAETPALIEVIRSDPVEEVRGWAARALAAIGTAEAMAAVQAAAQGDLSPNVRALAARLADTAEAAPEPQVAVAPAPATPVVAVQPALEEQAPRRRSRRPMILTIAGWSVFGAGYLVSALVGGVLVSESANFGWAWFVPLIGPAMYGTNLMVRSSDELFGIIGAFIGVLAWIPSLMQAAGLAVAIAGHVLGARQDREEEAFRMPRIAVSPVGPAGSLGLSVGGWL